MEQTNGKSDMIFACGSPEMIKVIQAYSQKTGIPVQCLIDKGH